MEPIIYWEDRDQQEVSYLSEKYYPYYLIGQNTGDAGVISLDQLENNSTDAVITYNIENILNQLKLIGIIIPDPSEVREYLIYHPEMVNLLIYVSEESRQEFGIYTQLSLEVYEDPEITDKYLTLYVRRHKYDKNVIEQIKKIRYDYKDMLVDISGWFLLTTDFRAQR
jgi:hypothetical protein